MDDNAIKIIKEGYKECSDFAYHEGIKDCWALFESISEYSIDEFVEVFGYEYKDIKDLLKHTTYPFLKDKVKEHQNSILKNSLRNLVKEYGGELVTKALQDVGQEDIDFRRFFDPETHIATEEQFIKFLNSKIRTKDVIGYKVKVSFRDHWSHGTSFDKPHIINYIFTIADLDHDCENIGYKGYYDLICTTVIDEQKFGDSDDYTSSDIREWLNVNFYTSISDNLKAHMLRIKYKYNDTWYDNDRLVIPSATELGLGIENDFIPEEGAIYPIFTADSKSRIRHIFNDSERGVYWTRTYAKYESATYAGAALIVVTVNGMMGSSDYDRYNYILPIIRVS